VLFILLQNIIFFEKLIIDKQFRLFSLVKKKLGSYCFSEGTFLHSWFEHQNGGAFKCGNLKLNHVIISLKREELNKLNFSNYGIVSCKLALLK